jgi:tRNA pseudouridine55 synthase
MFGFLNVNKPAGPTSHDIVASVRRRIGRRVKVGHAGTLDPFADGVLVLCIGPATRLASYVQAQPKRYRAIVCLGATSSTDDVQGETDIVPEAVPVDEDTVRNALGQFVGEIEQVPPAHSAVHVDGKRAYRLARAGQTPELKPRRVHVYALDLIRCEYPYVELDIRCGSGTYIRAIARDLGKALGTGGYCEHLTRTEIGAFSLDVAVPPDVEDIAQALRSPLEALSGLPILHLDEEQERHIRQGDEIRTYSGSGDVLSSQEAILLDSSERLVAIAELDPTGSVRPRKVFPLYAPTDPSA